MLKERLIVGILGAVLAIALMAFGNVVHIGIVISIIALIGLYEIYKALGFLKTNKPLCVIGFIAGALILYFSIMANFGQIFRLFVSAYMVILLIYMVLAHKTTSFTDISKSMFATMYVTLFFAYLILIRKYNNGEYLIWIPVITAWLSDTMAYTFGRLLGKHKLIPEVSPKKTVEGAVGGVFGGIIFMIIYGMICNISFGKEINWLTLSVLGMLGAVFSQFGDLAASWIKREFGIKDYGNLLPGHGGVLDRFDSVLIIAPIIYYFVQIFPIFK